jgi:hypothetical protein
MNQRHILRPLISSAIVASAVAVVGLSASAQTTTTTTTTAPTTSTTAVKPKPTSATDQMIQEACQRSKARTAKFQQNGTPEQFGSEEPFTYDPNAPRC